MSEEGEKPPDQNGEDTPSDTEFPYLSSAPIHVANSAAGDVGVQTGTVGSVNLYAGQSEADLVIWQVTDEEMDEARKQFVSPPQFADAEHALAQNCVVVLCGVGSGRSFAARRLLVDLGATTVAVLNPARAWHSIKSSDLEPSTGYIWELDETGARLRSDLGFNQCVRVVRELGSWLVIVLQERRQVPPDADNWTVTLGTPPPLEVARSAIRWRSKSDSAAALAEFGAHLADALDAGDPPAKAVRAADLAIRITQDETFSVADAIRELKENARATVERWAKDRPVIDFAMATAVAVLENQPYDEVVTYALDLDRRIREAELPEDKKLRPRRIFTNPKAVLLLDNKAQAQERPHPRHNGLNEETVRFCRQDWAGAVLSHVWQEYAAAHVVLIAWMCHYEFLARFTEATRRALCTIIADVPAHEPLRWVERLAANRLQGQRTLAASILLRLADEHVLRPLVEQTLNEWVESGTVNKKWTAAVVYGSPFGREDVPGALDKLERIARSKWAKPRVGVVQGMFNMVNDPDCRSLAMDRLLTWSEPAKGPQGPRQVAHSVAFYLAGFSRVADFDPDEFIRESPSRLRTLVHRALADADAGPEAVKRLSELALQASASEQAGTDLVRIALLITPDLSWWPRQRAALTLLRRHPRRYWTIQWILRVARRVQQATTKRPAAGPAAGDGTGPPDTS